MVKKYADRFSRRKFLVSTALSATTLGTTLSAENKSQALPAEGPRIDCQSHLFAPAVVALMETRQAEPMVRRRKGERWVLMGEWERRILPNHMDVASKIAAMDANGINMAALSVNDPGPEWFGEHGLPVARAMNDYIASVVDKHPRRFVGLGVLPVQEMSAAMEEFKRCVNELSLKGILLYTNAEGRFPDDPEFRPIFARAVELEVPIVLHPAKPVTTEAVKGYEMISALGNMFDDTIALTRIIMSGLLDEFPTLKLICPHLGGTLPFIIGRLDHQTQVLKRGPRNLKRSPSAYLKQVWFDIASPLSLAMRFAYDLIGADRLLFASDHPWVDPKLIVSGLRSLQLPAADEEKIFWENARSLFRP